MAAPTEREEIDNQDIDEFCTIEATVPSGFEPVAKGEVVEKIGAKCTELRGRIKFECPVKSVEKVIELGSVENCRVVILYEKNFSFTDDKVESMQRLRDLVGGVNWAKGVQIWKRFFTFEHPVAEVPEVITTNFGEPYFPPPRQNLGTSNRTRKSKGRKWHKKKKKDEIKASMDENVQSEEMAEEEQGEKTNANEEDAVNSNRVSEEVKADKEGLETTKPSSESCNNNSAITDSVDNSAIPEDKRAGSEPEENPSKKPRVRENPWDPLKPSFRVTCNRHGENHCFDSMTAAANFGGAIWRYFGWNVKMTEFDIEVILGIEEHELTVSIGLTKESLHRRNITHFGPTTLRPTLAYSMLRLCELQPGDVVCDPMCGSGSIPIQCSLNWPQVFNICGDIGYRSVVRTKDNTKDNIVKNKEENKPSVVVEPIRWNVTNMPLHDGSVDVFLTDLPFGVRVGRKVDNWRLYPGALIEMARVVKPNTGRCCLLTEDKKCIIKTLQKIGKYWYRTRTLGVNIGGLAAGVYVLKRTSTPFDKTEDLKLFEARGTKVEKELAGDGDDGQ